MLYRKSSITIEDHLKSGINVGDRLFAGTKTVEDFYLRLYTRGLRAYCCRFPFPDIP